MTNYFIFPDFSRMWLILMHGLKVLICYSLGLSKQTTETDSKSMLGAVGSEKDGWINTLSSRN